RVSTLMPDDAVNDWMIGSNE
ncbi:hypothetical protein D047_0101B, partial [Vibrio parahaemolyticus VPTS-2010_2]